MTLEELSRYSEMREELNRDEHFIEVLQSAAEPGAQVLSGMPHSPGVNDKVGNLAAEIADMKEKMKVLQAEIDIKGQEIDAFIKTIPDEYIHVLFRLHFIRCLTWREVARMINSTEQGVKALCYKYLRSDKNAGHNVKKSEVQCQ